MLIHSTYKYHSLLTPLSSWTFWTINIIELARYLPRRPASLVVRFARPLAARRHLKCRIQFPVSRPCFSASPFPNSWARALCPSPLSLSLRWDFLIQFHTSLVLPNLVLCRRRPRHRLQGETTVPGIVRIGKDRWDLKRGNHFVLPIMLFPVGRRLSLWEV